jgi:4-amino-4-deoxy-L-arabinose transferase-like glycosyltransferase
VRLAYLALNARTNPAFDYLVMDSLHIDAWARAIAAGDPGNAVYFRGPLVPYLYALVYRLGGGLTAALFVNQLAGAATCGFVWLLARSYFDATVAWTAGIAAALYWPLIYFDGELLTEPVYIALVVASLWRLERAAAAPSALRFAAAGACLGLAALARPTILALLPALPIFFFVRGRAWLRASVIVGAACAVVLAPALVHNFRAGRALVPVVWSGGLNFYLGNNPESDGRSALLPGVTSPWTGGEAEALAIASQQVGKPITAAEASRFYARLGMDFIVSRPADALGLFLRKLELFWEGPERSNEKYIYFFWREFGFGRLPTPGFWLVSPLALTGMLRLWPRRRELALLYGFVLTYMAGLIAFFVVARYRLPAVPALIVFAAWTAVELIRTLRSASERRRGLATLALAAVLFAGVNASYPAFLRDRAPNLAISHYTLARAERARGNPDGALDQLVRALDAYAKAPSPYHTGVAQDIYFDLGSLLADRGQCAEAARALGQVRPDHPHSTDARLRFAECSERTGRYDDALRAYRLVLGSDPHDVRARTGEARALEALDRAAPPDGPSR